MTRYKILNNFTFSYKKYTCHRRINNSFYTAREPQSKIEFIICERKQSPVTIVYSDQLAETLMLKRTERLRCGNTRNNLRRRIKKLQIGKALYYFRRCERFCIWFSILVQPSLSIPPITRSIKLIWRIDIYNKNFLALITFFQSNGYGNRWICMFLYSSLHFHSIRMLLTDTAHPSVIFDTEIKNAAL